MLANGMGGLDWAGLPLACAYHGVRNVEALVHRLIVIKQHNPKREPDGDCQAVD
jgi:hypothetical protein